MDQRMRPYRGGGLYRCCVARLADLPEAIADTEGNVTHCPDCKTPMLFADGAWQWAPWAGETPPFTCPTCGRASHNPNDARAGFCAHCAQYTGGKESTR